MEKHFSAEFKFEATKLVIDQHYTLVQVVQAMGVSFPAITRGVNKLRIERQGKTPAGLPITTKQLELREMKKKIQRGRVHGHGERYQLIR